MKNAFFVCILFFCNSGIAQTFPPNFNLVTNGGFELNNKSMVEDTSLASSKTCWVAAHAGGYPVNLFKPNYSLDAPTIKPRNGLTCINLQFYSGSWKVDTKVLFDSSLTLRAYAQTKLLQPLIAGVTYYLTFYAGQTKSSGKYPSMPSVNIPNVGAYFSVSKVSDYTNFGRINVKPQINFKNWTLTKLDSFEYVKLTDTFTAKGGEQYLTLGNFDYFKDYVLCHYVEGSLIPKGSDTLRASYNFMLIDDISLVRDTTQPMISLDKFSLGNDTTLCNGDTMRIGGEPHFFGYNWNTGDTSRFININKPGTYWCSADFGCNTVTDTIVVSGSMAPASFNIDDTAICEANLPISISAPYTAAAYLWSNGSTAFTTSFNSIGKQWLRISNACGDQHFTDTFDIKSLNVSLNNINLGKDTNNCLYGFYLDTISLQVPVNAATQIKWSNGSSNNNIKIWEPGAYWVQVSNVCYTVADTINITGCAARDVPKVDIPNAFTPNGDGKNDVFRLRYLPQQIVSFNLKIYNRYGQMISELRNRSDYWDGGNYELGVYYYLFVYKDISGKEYMQKGDISLLR